MKKELSRRQKIFRRVLLLVLALALFGGLFIGGVNLVMLLRGAPHIAPDAEKGAESLAGSEWDCILVLGAGVHDDGTPSDMLTDRLETGIALYKAGVAPKLLMSGDHGRVDYDEVNVMRQYALDRGVPEEDVFMDHAGFSTYESMYRARDVFACRRIIVVTQSYHLYRALYVANALGLEAEGVSADIRTYRGQVIRDLREAAARAKDFLYTVFQPAPTYLGDVIPISGSGTATLG